MFITQVEVYLRSKNIDDCANTTITIQYPEKPRFLVEQKHEFQNQWLEAKVYYKNFEFLINDYLCGNNSNDMVNAFLGASLGNQEDGNAYWRIYVPLDPTPIVKQ